jgi:hypothetical protein
MHKFYLDMDGVLCNFDKKRIELGITSYDFGPEGWEILDKIPHLFYHLEPMPDAFELWEYLKPLNPTILTAIPKKAQLEHAASDKRLWIAKHLGGDVPVITCYGEEKQNYADREAVLIDDFGRNIGQWIKRGGIGVLHTDTRTTLQILNELPSVVQQRNRGLNALALEAVTKINNR